MIMNMFFPSLVVSRCGSPGPELQHGRTTSNSSDSSDDSTFPIWTTVTFLCHTGYQLVGPSLRQCRPNGQWSGKRNPTCQGMQCKCGLDVAFSTGNSEVSEAKRRTPNLTFVTF